MLLPSPETSSGTCLGLPGVDNSLKARGGVVLPALSGGLSQPHSQAKLLRMSCLESRARDQSRSFSLPIKGCSALGSVSCLCPRHSCVSRRFLPGLLWHTAWGMMLLAVALAGLVRGCSSSGTLLVSQMATLMCFSAHGIACLRAGSYSADVPPPCVAERALGVSLDKASLGGLVPGRTGCDGQALHTCMSMRGAALATFCQGGDWVWFVTSLQGQAGSLSQ